MAARLKTYTAELDGLNDWIVAAPNQKAALAAFGVHQNLFAQDRAGTTDEPEAVKAALAEPGQPLKRPKGGKGRFVAGPAEDDWSRALTAAKSEAPAEGRKPASRARLDKAEAALADEEAEAENALGQLEADVAKARERLEAGRARLEARLEKAREAVEAARAAYRKASA